MVHIEENDDVVFKFKGATIVEVFEDADFELNKPVEDLFEAGETIEVTILDVNEIAYDIQFGDGSVAFIRKDLVEVVSVNYE
jgi:hypothetical protein